MGEYDQTWPMDFPSLAKTMAESRAIDIATRTEDLQRLVMSFPKTEETRALLRHLDLVSTDLKALRRRIETWTYQG